MELKRKFAVEILETAPATLQNDGHNSHKPIIYQRIN